MKFLVIPDEEGQYINADGERFNIIYGGYVVGPKAKDFKQFGTLKQALEYYKLTEANVPVKKEEEEK